MTRVTPSILHTGKYLEYFKSDEFKLWPWTTRFLLESERTVRTYHSSVRLCRKQTLCWAFFVVHASCKKGLFTCSYWDRVRIIDLNLTRVLVKCYVSYNKDLIISCQLPTYYVRILRRSKNLKVKTRIFCSVSNKIKEDSFTQAWNWP